MFYPVGGAEPNMPDNITRPKPQTKHPLLENMPRWYSVRGDDHQMLFRFCPSALVVEIVVRGEKYLVDLMEYINKDAELETAFYRQTNREGSP
jgi:hypothetical protein